MSNYPLGNMYPDDPRSPLYRGGQMVELAGNDAELLEYYLKSDSCEDWREMLFERMTADETESFISAESKLLS